MIDTVLVLGSTVFLILEEPLSATCQHRSIVQRYCSLVYNSTCTVFEYVYRSNLIQKPNRIIIIIL